MKYNFDKPTNRRITNSLKWDVSEEELPLWVADMDFETAPEVREALQKRLEEGIFGYEIIPEEWYEAIVGWWETRHHYHIKKEWLIFCTGVIPAITSSVKRVTNPGDNVVIQTPVYDIFFHSVENTGRHVLENQLVYDENGYHMDFEMLERQLANPLTTMMILCNPQNPGGKTWSKEELRRVGSLCRANHVVLLSDEIHCDLTDPGVEYVPFASASKECEEISITCIAASKAFNIAGLQSAAVFVPNEGLRNNINRGLNSDEVAEGNSFATTAAIAAFRQGGPWLDQLRQYLYENKEYVREFMKNHCDKVKVTKSDATYLLWLDCSDFTDNTDELCGFLREKHKLYLTTGSQYRGNGAAFIRLNTACQRTTLEEALHRFDTGLHEYLEQI